MMDFLEEFFERRGARHPRQHDDHGRYAARPYPEESNGDPRYANVSEHKHAEHHADRGDHPGRAGLPGVLGALAQRKTLLVVAALLLFAVAIGGMLAMVLLLPVAGRLLALADGQNLSAVLGDLPRLLTTLLVDLPKTVLEYLAPLLQLKGALEGKA